MAAAEFLNTISTFLGMTREADSANTHVKMTFPRLSILLKENVLRFGSSFAHNKVRKGGAALMIPRCLFEGFSMVTRWSASFGRANEKKCCPRTDGKKCQHGSVCSYWSAWTTSTYLEKKQNIRPAWKSQKQETDFDDTTRVTNQCIWDACKEKQT